jgi:aminopeptidase N
MTTTSGYRAPFYARDYRRAEANLHHYSWSNSRLRLAGNGAAAAYTYDGHQIVISLPNVPTGQGFSTEVDYEGNPSHSDDVYNLGMFFMTGYLFTLSDPSGVRWWMPAYDHPWDKSTIHYAITVRDDWTVACNGLRTGIVNNGDGTATTSWQCDDPIVPHLFVIHAGAFLEYDQQFGDIPIQNFIPRAITTPPWKTSPTCPL